MMKLETATIADVENALVAFIAAAEADPELPEKHKKKLATAVEALMVRDTKELKQAFTNAEKWWAVNAFKRKEGCTPENREEMMKVHIKRSTGWARFASTDEGRAKAESWMADTFRAQGHTNDRA